MAKSSSKITKYESGETIVTAKVANSWYGGLHGTTEGDSLDSDDPQVAGHVHDGQHLDGHAQKVDLVSHVTNKLRNINIATDAVDKRTVTKQISQNDAIPEYEVIDGNTHYYLDLSVIRDEIDTVSVFIYDSENDLIHYNEDKGATFGSTDFVVGSDTLESDGVDIERMFFDISKGAFRAGIGDGEWDDANRGIASIALGNLTTAAGDNTFAGGESTTVDSSSESSGILTGTSNSISNSKWAFIGGGGEGEITGAKPTSKAANSISNESHWSVLVGGGANTIGSTTISYASFLGGGTGNSIDADESFLGGGDSNSINGAVRSGIVVGESNTIGNGGNSAQSAFIGGGISNNLAEGKNAVICGGDTNTINDAVNGIIGAGEANNLSSTSADADWSCILAGRNNTVDSSDESFIGAGNGNSIEFNSTRSVIVGGSSNRVGSQASTLQAVFSGIVAGQSNVIEEYWSLIGSGRSNTINDGSTYNIIGAGQSNTIGDGSYSATHSAICSGHSNNVVATHSFIGGGSANDITNVDYSTISGGEGHLIECLDTPGITAPDWSGIFSGKNNEILTGRGAIQAAVSAGGSGYAVGDILRVDDSSLPKEAKIEVTSVSTGAVTAAVVHESGYWLTDPTNPVSTIAETGSGTGATFNLSNADLATIGDESNYSAILSGHDNGVFGSDSSVIVGGINNFINNKNSSIIGAGQGNDIYFGASSAILTGRSNQIRGLGNNADLSNNETILIGDAIINGQYNKIEKTAHNAVAMGQYALANSYGMVSQASDNFSQTGTDFEAGQAQTAVVTFVGESGSTDSTNYYIYLNNEGVEDTPGSNTTGFGLFIPENTSGIIHWTAVGAEDGTTTTIAYRGMDTFYRSTGDVNLVDSDLVTVTALSGSGSIQPFVDTKFSAGSRESIIFEVTTGSTGAGNGTDTRWIIRTEVTWCQSTFP